METVDYINTERPTDTRPIDCRFRCQDEMRAYPRSSCHACKKTITTGLGRECSMVRDVAKEVRDDLKLIDYPTEAGKVVSMIAFNDQVLIACEYGVFEIVDGKAVRLKFVRGF